mgnify:CR=1 FL=1
MAKLYTLLKKASDSLTEANWRKGSYFSSDGPTLCMCAHGAQQAQVNKQVRDIVSTFGGSLPAAKSAGSAAAATAAVVAATTSAEGSAAASGAGAAAAAAATTTATAAGTLPSLVDAKCAAFRKRPKWVRERNLDSHYIMGLVGLTASFNDRGATTLGMVKEKFAEAIIIARILNV